MDADFKQIQKSEEDKAVELINFEEQLFYFLSDNVVFKAILNKKNITKLKRNHAFRRKRAF